MNKGLTDSFIGLYRSIFEDIVVYHPTLREEFSRDLKRLEALSENSGINVFTLMLPAIGKAFFASLESGVLSFDGLPLTRSINRRSAIPRLFRGMWLTMFEHSGCLRRDINHLDVQRMSTILFSCKKFEVECSAQATMSTVKEYYDVDEQLPAPSQSWDGDGSDLPLGHSRSLLDLLHPNEDLFSVGSLPRDEARMLSVCQHVADRVSSLFGVFYPSQSRFRHGPGAVSDSTKGKRYKYHFLEWGPRLQWVFPAAEFAFANLRVAGATDDYEAAGLPLREGASMLYAVPKTQKAPRLIAAEPTCNQWAQQSVRHWLTDVIRSNALGDSIDFSRQDLSGELALAASADKSLATVDLSAASDRLSCWLVERLFRANSSLLSSMIACRTRYIINTIDKKSPKLHKLRKFASMGSALTFPIQSISFYIICVAAGVLAENADVGDWKRLGRQVRVYGDDLIVPVSWMPFVEQLLKRLFLKVNRAKTFTEGNFRESCGTNAYAGHSVSPGQILHFYDESKLSTLQGVVDSSNNLFAKGFERTAQYLVSPVAPAIRKLIPDVAIGAESFGLWSAMGFS
ncbi:TPA_asm: RNA-directed RNA polymerase, partial [ssRNA phage Esthiorhiza.4_11]